MRTIVQHGYGDVAGTVERVGAGVEGFAVGDRVVGRGTGTFAEYALASAASLVQIPDGVEFDTAAALPVSGCAALLSVRKAAVAPGGRVLVLGAGGGVGHFALQLARLAGGRVTAVVSPTKEALVRELGAEAVVDYTTTPLAGEYDVIIDTGGGRPIPVLRSLLSERGRLVVVGAESGAGMGRMLSLAVLSPFVKQRLSSLVSTEKAEDLAELVGLVAEGRLRVAIDGWLPVEQAAEAIRRLRSGSVAGKLVLVP